MTPSSIGGSKISPDDVRPLLRDGVGLFTTDLVTSGGPDREAILGPGFPSLSYADLADKVSAIAAELSELGVARQDRVALVMPNGPSMAIDLLGVMATGIAAPLNPQYTAEELRFFSRISGRHS